jgi:hypothetical protein
MLSLGPVSPGQRLYLIGQSCIGAAIANAIINGAIGWGITRGAATFPMWSIPGVAGDLAATAFGVTFGTCVCMAVQVPWDFGRGKITPVPISPAVAALLARFPRGTLYRGLGLGALSVPLFALPVVAALAVLDRGAMDRWPFIVLKAIVSAVQGAIVTPFIVLGVLGDVVRRRGALPPEP